MIAGEPLVKPCINARHGVRIACDGPIYTRLEHDPLCQTCTVRAMLSEHDHLHLGSEKCETPGVGGTPGVNVKCTCGSYHH